MKRRKILFHTLFLGILLSLFNCAKRGTPTGGPKDELPPEIVNTNPENYSIGFDENEIRISFNEFVKLNDLQKQLVVSPPLKYPPVISPQGGAAKTIKIEITDTLKENTTYVFNFGQSIVDNNEGNPYPFFNYVFSTGSYIDSLTLSGSIADAAQKEPDNFVSVMLYEVDSTYNDSIVYTTQPTYITNTLDSLTEFTLSNLKAGTYRLVAVKDEAQDNIYSPASDKIGFISEDITLPTDTTYQITLFKEVPAFRWVRPVHIKKDKIAFGYEGDPAGASIEILSDTPDDFRSVVTKQADTDSLNYYFTPIEADSLIFRVAKEQHIDTFTVRMRNLYKDSLTVDAITRGQLQLKDTFRLTSNIPMEKFDSERIEVLDRDSTAIAFQTYLNKENNQLQLHWNPDFGQRYAITLFPGALSDFFGNTNDTLNYSISTKELDQLGTIRVVLANVESYPLILELTDNKDEVKHALTIDRAMPSYEFSNIDPGSYFIRVIHDVNGNRKWDTGNYLQKVQPEKISYYPDAIELRANWEIEQTFILE